VEIVRRQLPFQDGYLLAQREDFESNIRTASEEATSRGDQG
jgi:hypothetical protein